MSAPMPAARRSSSASRSAPSSAPTRSRACSIAPSPWSPTRPRRRRCAASARGRPIWRSSAAWTRSPTCSASIRSRCAGAIMIRHEEFPYLIPSGTTYDSGDYHTVIDKVLAHTSYEELKAERDRLRARRQARRHRHRRLPGAVRRQRHLRGAAQSGHHHLHLHGFLPHQRGRPGRHHRHHAHHLLRPGPRDAGRHRGRRGVAGRSGPRCG